MILLKRTRLGIVSNIDYQSRLYCVLFDNYQDTKMAVDNLYIIIYKNKSQNYRILNILIDL